MIKKTFRLLLITIFVVFFLFVSDMVSNAQDNKKLKFSADDTIEEIKEKIKQNGYHFKVKENWVFKLSAGAKKSMLRRRMPISPLPVTRRKIGGPLLEEIMKNEHLPKNFDWRNFKGHSYIGKIRNQGGCGSCYSFGASAAAESAYNIVEGLYDDRCADFSESFIIWCLGRLPDYSNHFSGCGGADYDYFELEALTKHGIISEEQFKYSETDPGKCDYMQTPAIKFDSWFRVFCGDIEAIKRAIIGFGVVDAAVFATSAFMAYDSGIYEDTLITCETQPGKACYYTPTNHAVALVGWGYDEDTGLGYWILRNSWGEDWGEKGYMRISYNAARVSCAVCFLVYQNESSQY